MRCPYCKENITIQGKFCPKCGEQIFGLPVDRGDREDRQRDRGPESDQQQYSQPPRPVIPPTSRGRPTTSSPDLIDVDIDGEDTGVTQQPRVIEAGEEHVGKTCPYCRFPIKPGEEIVVCPECEVPHHADCWDENDGCTTYGCTGGAQVAQSRYTPRTSASDWQRSTPSASRWQGTSAETRSELGFNELQGAELEARANNALILSVFGLLCFIPALVGFFMGIRVLGQIRQNPALINHPARGRAIGAIMVSGLFIALWVILFIGSLTGAG